METSILYEFLVLEETNSFSKAAMQLQTSQASLSRHIKQLETEYGVPLFERTTQKMRLTPYGESLVVYARSILEKERSFKRDVEKIRFQSSNHLVIGSVDFPFYYGITSHLAGFKKEHPNATLEVVVKTTDDLIQALRDGTVDVAFFRNIQASAEEFEAFPYAKDQLYIAVPAEHPLADLSSATLDAFSQDRFYKRYKKNSLMEQLLNQLFTQAGFTPKISAGEAGWEDSVINDLNSVSICTGGLAENFRGNLHIKVLSLEPTQEVNLYLGRSLENPPSEIASQFLAYVKASLQ